VKLSEQDEAYVRASFVALDELSASSGRSPADVRALIAEGRLPKPAYVLNDGTDMVAADFFELLDDAGDLESLRADFVRRFVAASGADEDAAAEEWEAYLSGEYAVCLRHVMPETIARKGQVMEAIERLVSRPNEGEPGWRAALREAVGALDELERPFAEYDRVRFGAPSWGGRGEKPSRARFPAVFS
jgi:hypothetical protein